MSRTGPEQRRGARRAAHRTAAFALALVWSAAPLLAAVHATTERHRFCAAHGTVEETSEGGAAPAHLPTVAGQSLASSHEDCSFASACRFGQTLLPDVGASVGFLSPETVAAPVDARPAPSLDVLANAPKTSPPRG